MNTHIHNRIMEVLKVETDLITSIAMRPIGWAVILLIVYVETFQNVIMCLETDRYFPLSESVNTDSITQYQRIQCQFEITECLSPEQFNWKLKATVLQTYKILLQIIQGNDLSEFEITDSLWINELIIVGRDMYTWDIKYDLNKELKENYRINE